MTEFEAGRPVVLRGATVLPMDAGRSVLADTDVLVTGDTIAAVGPRLAVSAAQWRALTRRIQRGR